MRDQAFTSMKGKQILQFACVELGYLNDLMILNLGTSVISTNTRTVPVPERGTLNGGVCRVPGNPVQDRVV